MPQTKDAPDLADGAAPETKVARSPHHTLRLPILGTVARDAPVNTPRIVPVSDPIADGLTLGSSTPNIGNQAKPAKASLPDQIKVVEKTQMLEINPGIWDGLTPDQAKKYYPEDWERFTKDPYSYRVPRAESYHDLSSE
jgi:6-phosphofructo-2-kinase/fructose-2,6-biphosphatase 4